MPVGPVVPWIPFAGPALPGTAGNVLTSNGPTSAPTFQPATGGGGGIGARLTFTSPSGAIDPNIVGFTAGIGSAGTGRLYVTLSADTSWEGLPAGADGQQLFITVIAGAFTLTLLHLNGSTAQQEILASTDFSYALNDTAQLFYDGTLTQWVLVG